MIVLSDFQTKVSIKKIIHCILFGVFLLSTVVICIRSDEEKNVYKEDVNRQFEKMYEYSVKPISAEKMDRLGGGYSAEFKYGVLTEEAKDLLISEIKKDGFRDPHIKTNCDGMHFCKGKVGIAIVEGKESKRIRLLIRQNDYDVNR